MIAVVGHADRSISLFWKISTFNSTELCLFFVEHSMHSLHLLQGKLQMAELMEDLPISFVWIFLLPFIVCDLTRKHVFLFLTAKKVLVARKRA